MRINKKLIQDQEKDYLGSKIAYLGSRNNLFCSSDGEREGEGGREKRREGGREGRKGGRAEGRKEGRKAGRKEETSKQGRKERK